jgi:catecholate siderophore receptor
LATIRSRKHSTPVSRPLQPALPPLIAAALAMPLAAHAQQADQTQTLPAVQVQSTADVPYKADTTVSPKYTQPLVDTPQTITVIKKELMDQQRATTLTEALRNTPAVGTFSLGENGSTNLGDSVFMRGFDASSAIFIDNVRDAGQISRDMFNVEQIEVLKGPAGADNGRGSPTGSINLVTKQAHQGDAFDASASYGSWSQKRVTADWNKSLNKDNGTAFRINLMKQDSGVPGRHEVENDHQGIAAAFAYGLGSDTRVFVDFLHYEQNDVPDGGVPTIGLPGSNPGKTAAKLAGAAPVNSANFYGLSSDHNDVNADRFTVRFEKDLSPDVKLQNTTRYARTKQDYQLTSYMWTAANLNLTSANPADWTMARSNVNIRDNQINDILTNQTYVTAKLNTGTLQHTLFGGVEFTREKQTTDGFTYSGALPAANLYNPNPDAGQGSFKRTSNDALDGSGKTDTVSAYLFDTIKFNEQWSINGGIRVDHYNTDYDCGATYNTTQKVWNCAASVSTTTSTPAIQHLSQGSSGNLFNWKLAGIYKPTENSSLYALYATSQQPPGGSNFSLSAAPNSGDNPNFAPQKTKTAEVGTKWDVLNKRLALTAAIYRTEVNNDIELQSDGTYAQVGKKRVQGVELGAVGAITDKWSVSAGYSYMDTKVLSNVNVTAAGTGDGLAYTPKNAFTLWTTYELPKGFTIGGGARYVGGLTKLSDGADALGTPPSTEGYWVFDAMASYIMNKNVDFQLNLYNLFNKDYVAGINKSGYRYTPGTPRAAMLTANVHF